MTQNPAQGSDPDVPGSRRLMLLLAMAMFVLVVDTSLMNVSISAVITDLDTTASGVQSAIALEALDPPASQRVEPQPRRRRPRGGGERPRRAHHRSSRRPAALVPCRRVTPLL